ncbi:hypothetical protein F5Y09DRAFT_343153 [Xylaria sp. FL1042]|nr:hypothetical protein F5Y09DRAFT_343153 [Xylaria sp. FL1042]
MSSSEDNYTAVRPPQYKDSNLPSGMSLSSGPSVTPENVVTRSQAPGRPTSSQGEDAPQHYPASDSTATVRADEVAATTQATQAPRRDPTPRAHILFYIDRDYNGATPPLTERALAAHNHYVAHASVNGHIDEWIRGRSQFSAADPVDINMSILRNDRTETATRCGSSSSWSMISSSTLTPLQIEPVADVVCDTGVQFADVSAPIGHLLDEVLV